jgi:uncharacterized protein (UPF0371 family)
MTLTALIRKQGLPVTATAKTANFANEPDSANDKLAITAKLALAAPQQAKPSQLDKAALSHLVVRVLRDDRWQEDDIAIAVSIAISDYHDALICFSEQAQLKGIRFESSISTVNFERRR